MRWILLVTMGAGCAAEAAGSGKWAHEEQSAPCSEGVEVEFELPADAVAITLEATDMGGQRGGPAGWKRTDAGIVTPPCTSNTAEYHVGYLTAD